MIEIDRERERERETETQAEGEAGSMQEARHGTRSLVSRITPWAKGRRQTAEPPRDPLKPPFDKKFSHSFGALLPSIIEKSSG